MTTPAQGRRAERQIGNVLADIKIVPLTAAVGKHPRSFERVIAYRMIQPVPPIRAAFWRVYADACGSERNWGRDERA